MPTTPRGTRTWRSCSPLGSVDPRTTSPTGSGSAIRVRSASATPATRPASSRSRSTTDAGVPAASAASTSRALAARTSSTRSTSASAIPASAPSLTSVGRVRSTRAAARARSAAAPISGRSAASDTPARVRGTTRRLDSARAQGPQRGLARLAGQPVEEDLAVEVVDLVLQAAGHQAGALQAQRLAVDVEPLGDGVHRPDGGGVETRHRQTALVAVLDLLRLLGEPRVDHVPDHAVDVVGEDAQAHADLRGRQPGPAGVVDGLLQVAHEGREVLVEGAHLVGRRAQHRVTEF